MTLWNGRYIETYKKQLSESTLRPEYHSRGNKAKELFIIEEIRWLGTNFQRLICNVIPTLEVDEGIDISWEVLWIDGNGIARFVFVVITEEEVKLSYILIIRVRPDTFHRSG